MYLALGLRKALNPTPAFALRKTAVIIDALSGSNSVVECDLAKVASSSAFNNLHSPLQTYIPALEP